MMKYRGFIAVFKQKSGNEITVVKLRFTD